MAVFRTRHFSQLVKTHGKRLFLIDTLAFVKRLEGEGIPSKHAEAITAVATEVLNDSLENVSQSLVSKVEMQKTEMIQEANMSEFKAEVKSSQEHRFSLLQHETEKLRNDIKKMGSEFRDDMEKMSSKIENDIEKMSSKFENVMEKMGSRFMNNMEKMSSEYRNDMEKMGSELRNDMEKIGSELRYEIGKVDHSFRAQLEAAKYDVIKYGIGCVFLIFAGIAVLWK